MARKKPNNKPQALSITCPACERTRSTRNHYKLGGKFQVLTKYGLYPVCKDCLEAGFKSIEPLDLKKQRDYLMMLCQTMNKPFITSVFDSAYKSEKNTFREFFSMISTAKYNNKDFLDGNGIRENIGEEVLILSDESKEKWIIYEMESKQEVWCEKFYQTTKTQNSITENSDNILDLTSLAVLNMRIGEEARKGKPLEIKQLQAAISKIKESLGILTEKVEKAGGAKSFGQLIDMMEQDDPGFEVLEEYQDVDKLLAATKMILGSTSVMLGKTDKQKFREEHLKEFIVE